MDRVIQWAKDLRTEFDYLFDDVLKADALQEVCLLFVCLLTFCKLYDETSFTTATIDMMSRIQIAASAVSQFVTDRQEIVDVCDLRTMA